jgi:hypothetical protein
MVQPLPKKVKENIENLKLLDNLVKESLALSDDFFNQEIIV